MKKKLYLPLLLFAAGLILFSGCTRQNLPDNNEPEDISIRVEEPVDMQVDAGAHGGRDEPQISEVPGTVEAFTEADEFKDALSVFIESEFETVNTGLGIIDRADIGTGYVEVKRFENGLLGSVSFYVPYDAQDPENAVLELADYAGILSESELGDEQLLELAETAAACSISGMTEPVPMEFGEVYLFLIYDKETGYISLSK